MRVFACSSIWFRFLGSCGLAVCATIGAHADVIGLSDLRAFDSSLTGFGVYVAQPEGTTGWGTESTAV